MGSRNGSTRVVVVERADALRQTAVDAAEAALGYVSPLARDEKVRERLAAAIAAGATVHRRRRRAENGLRAVVQLASDPEVRVQLLGLARQLRAAQRRDQSSRARRAL